MPSSSGSAIVAPTPRKNARRGMAFLKIIMAPNTSCGNIPVLPYSLIALDKRFAPSDARKAAVVVSGADFLI